MNPGDLLVLQHSEMLFTRLDFHIEMGLPTRVELEQGDVLVYLETFINPKVPKERPSPDISNVDEGEGHLYCHVLKVLTRRGVLWVNDNGCVKPIDV